MKKLFALIAPLMMSALFIPEPLLSAQDHSG
jgi:hypothetical protein